MMQGKKLVWPPERTFGDFVDSSTTHVNAEYPKQGKIQSVMLDFVGSPCQLAKAIPDQVLTLRKGRYPVFEI